MAIVNPNAQAITQIRRPGDIWWADGFDSGNMYVSGQTQGITYSTASARVQDGSYGLAHTTTDNGGSFVIKTGLSNISEIIFGMAVKITGFGGVGGGAGLISWRDESSTQLSLNISTTGALFFHRTSAPSVLGTVLATTGAAAFTTGVYHWIDGKIRIHNTLGYVEARMNSVPVCSASGVNTRNATNNSINGFVLNNSDANTNFGVWMDDLYMIFNPDDSVPYPGDMRVYDMVPNLDGTHQDFVPSTGTDHYTMIDELGAVSDLDYVTSNETGAIDTYSYTSLPANALSVYGVVHGIRAQKTDAGARTMRFIQRQGGVDYEKAPQTDIALANSFQDHFVQAENINPATGLAWTVEELNNDTEFGFKIQS